MDESRQSPALLLLPNLLGEHKYHQPYLPNSVDKAVKTIDGLIAESDKEGRRYLSRFETKLPTQSIPIALLNEHTPDSDLDFLLEPIVKGERWGFVSDAGLPCIADPGSKLVRRARQRGLLIQTFVGPSSIILSLMLSGLPSQQFAFQGYLDKDPNRRKSKIKELIRQSQRDKSTQIFIEAPYRNMHTLNDLIDLIPDQAWLCVAWDLTLPTQGILSQTGASWKRSTLPNLEKKPAIFLISSE